MNYTVKAGQRYGNVTIPSSKSYAHRKLICAALSGKETEIICDGMSKDITATAECLRALGTSIDIDGDIIRLKPGERPDGLVTLPCNESGSTLRFLLPVAAALGMRTIFEMAEGLARRPVDDLIKVMMAHGVKISKRDTSIFLEGKMEPGNYTIPGNVSSQYISGLLFALPLLDGDSRLVIAGDIESADYIRMTEDALKSAGISFSFSNGEYIIPGNQEYLAKEKESVEKDWSNAAFFLCMGALSEQGITLRDMPLDSSQGDKRILEVLKKMGADIKVDGGNITVKQNRLKAVTLDASEIPDLVPVIAVTASFCEGKTVIKNAGRLRIKESDRLKTTSKMLRALGAEINETEDGLIIEGKYNLNGGTIDACNDHRIAMASAVAACGCRNDVCVLGAQCVEKSYPKFWEHLEGLVTINE